jgi:hypothetical protein
MSCCPGLRVVGVVVVGSVATACGGAAAVLPGTWTGVDAETRAIDVTVDGDLNETITSDVVDDNDDAHDFVFVGDGTGTVTTRAIFNIVSLQYLVLDAPTETPFDWQVDGDDDGEALTFISADGVNGRWDVVSASGGEVVLRLVVRNDFSPQQYAERTTTLTLRR